MAQRFTDKFIAALRPKDERYERWEGGGFGIRVSPRGKAWVWVYRYEGRPRRMTLGSYPAMGLSDARCSPKPASYWSAAAIPLTLRFSSGRPSASPRRSRS